MNFNPPNRFIGSILLPLQRLLFNMIISWKVFNNHFLLYFKKVRDLQKWDKKIEQRMEN